MALSSTFSANGVSASQAVAIGQRVSYSITGTFAARVWVEVSEDNGQSWFQIESTKSVRDGGSFIAKRSCLMRFRCSDRVSGTVTYALTVLGAVLQDWNSDRGKRPLRITDDGIEVGGDVTLPSNVQVLVGSGAPTDATTGAGTAGPGSLYVDATNANLYINGNTKASPTWKLVTRAA